MSATHTVRITCDCAKHAGIIGRVQQSYIDANSSTWGSTVIPAATVHNLIGTAFLFRNAPGMQSTVALERV